MVVSAVPTAPARRARDETRIPALPTALLCDRRVYDETQILQAPFKVAEQAGKDGVRKRKALTWECESVGRGGVCACVAQESLF